MGSFYLTCVLFIVFILGGILRLVGFNIFKLLGFIKNELLIVLGTSSSEAALPSLMKKLQKLGCSEPVVGLVIPTGYSFNLDGTCIYLTMAAVFLAQATDTPLDFGQQLTLLLVLLLTSKGAAGVTGSGFIVLAATLPTVGHIPVGAIALIFGIDRFMSEGRAITNIIGNTVATIVVAKWEKELDLEKIRSLI
jgi:aerobic C4-dicarboxylate transport protein